jgi:selenocysteine lyase/cysteine desulfurase
MPIDKESVSGDLLCEAGVAHLDNAGAALMPRCVLETQIDHLRLEAAVGGYEAERLRSDQLDAVYDSVARLLNCRRDEVAIVENASVGWMMAFYAIPFEPGDRILTAEAEYASNYLAYLQIACDRGVVVETVPSTADGELCIESLRKMIDERVKLISITHVPTNGGLVNPVEEIGAIARANDILYLVDACQSAGQIPLDVDAIQCDFLSASATWIDADHYELRKDARRFENWESNYAAKLGLGSAIDYALNIGLDEIETEVSRLADILRARLGEIDGVSLHDIGKRKCGIVTFAVAGVDAAGIESGLRENGIHVSVSSPVSTLIDATRRQLPDLVRAGVHYYNREAEIDALVRCVKAMSEQGA